MPRLRYSAASKEDLKEIARFIANDKPIAARQWVAKLRDKCRLAAQHPHIGDDRNDLGDGIRSTCVGSYIIYFRQKNGTLEIVRVLRGDLEFPFLQALFIKGSDPLQARAPASAIRLTSKGSDPFISRAWYWTSSFFFAGT